VISNLIAQISRSNESFMLVDSVKMVGSCQIRPFLDAFQRRLLLINEGIATGGFQWVMASKTGSENRV